MSLIPNASDLEKAGQQLGDQLEGQAVQLITDVVLPKLKETFQQAVDGLQVDVHLTINITRKDS